MPPPVMRPFDITAAVRLPSRCRATSPFVVEYFCLVISARRCRTRIYENTRLLGVSGRARDPTAASKYDVERTPSMYREIASLCVGGTRLKGTIRYLLDTYHRAAHRPHTILAHATTPLSNRFKVGVVDTRQVRSFTLLLFQVNR